MDTLHTIRHWREDVMARASLGILERLRLALLDTKHYALREILVRAYLRRHSVRRLQLGAGGNLLDGWLNTDCLPFSRKVAFLDATRRFPLPDHSFDVVFSEHQIEHVTYTQACFMLRECFRVLRRGGRLRVATPDLERLLRLYPEPGPEGEHYIRIMTSRFLQGAPTCSPVFVINLCMRAAGHQFLFDGATLSAAIEAAGFVRVERLAPGISRAPELNGMDAHERFIGDAKVNEYETMVYEAVKP